MVLNWVKFAYNAKPTFTIHRSRLQFQPYFWLGVAYCIENFPHSLGFWCMLEVGVGGSNKEHSLLVHFEEGGEAYLF